MTDYNHAGSRESAVVLSEKSPNALALTVALLHRGDDLLDRGGIVAVAREDLVAHRIHVARDHLSDADLETV